MNYPLPQLASLFLAQADSLQTGVIHISMHRFAFLFLCLGFWVEVGTAFLASAQRKFYLVCEFVAIMPALCIFVEIRINNRVLGVDLFGAFLGQQRGTSVSAQKTSISYLLPENAFGEIGTPIGVDLLSSGADLVELHPDLVFDFVEFCQRVLEFALLHAACC